MENFRKGLYNIIAIYDTNTNFKLCYIPAYFFLMFIYRLYSYMSLFHMWDSIWSIITIFIVLNGLYNHKCDIAI